jgi:DNA-binding CsgD family transcriptional regulator
MSEALEHARAAFARQAWTEAYQQFARAEKLERADLQLLATASYMLGHDDESKVALEQAHSECAKVDDHERAATCAFWLGLLYLLAGEPARGSGWLGRAERAVRALDGKTPVRGLLLVPQFLQTLEEDLDAALAIAEEMSALADQMNDADLTAFSVLCSGEVLIARGDTRRGLAQLDEIMVFVTTGELLPICAGIMYCAVVDSCVRTFDVARAAEWTDALTRWCEAQPDLVPYRGQCLVHRAQVLQANGSWTEAQSEVNRACELLAATAHPALGLAHFQRAELHRVRGEFDDAERAYRAASEHGFEPVPGLARLRLATGNITAAVAAIDRMTAECQGPIRPAVLAAAVEIQLAADNLDAARRAASELAGLVDEAAVPYLRAMSAYATGNVRLGEGDAVGALRSLREACNLALELGLPYDAARARMQIARSCRMLHDTDAADLELDAARGCFERLGARCDLEQVLALAQHDAAATAGDLTVREREVLRLVAGGMTNRAIAAELHISEHTVARHLQNMFMKLGLSSRAAATAYAYEHHLT